MRLIWQDDEPKGFKIKFENNLTKDLIFNQLILDERFFKLAHNGLRLKKVGDFEAQTFF